MNAPSALEDNVLTSSTFLHQPYSYVVAETKHNAGVQIMPNTRLWLLYRVNIQAALTIIIINPHHSMSHDPKRFPGWPFPPIPPRVHSAPFHFIHEHLQPTA